MIARDGLLLRGIRWRPGLSLLTVLTATIAVAAAVLGPMYQHTAGDSVLRRAVAAAPVQTSGVTLVTERDRSGPLGRIQRAERTLAAGTRAEGWFGTPITTIETGAAVYPRGEQPTTTRLFARTGICGVLRFRAGGCRLAAGEAIISTRTAALLHARVGQRLRVSAGTSLKLTIAGIYAVPDLDLPYWWGDGPSDFPGGASSSLSGPQTDPLIVSAQTALAVPAGAVPTATSQLPLRPGTVHLHNEAALRHTITSLQARLDHQGVRLGTQLLTVLHGADHQRHVMATIVAIAATQLVLLALWMLASLLVRSSDARRSEARVARLRGFPPISMLWVTAAEPGLLCLLGAALGVAIAWGAMQLARAQLFAPASSISFDAWTLGALLLTLLAIVAALGIGTMRLLRSADLSERPTRTPGSASTLSLVGDAVLIVLAVVALVALGTSGALSGHTDPIASAAPGLIALGSAVLAVQVILFACRLGIQRSANSGRVGSFLALRQTVRRPGVLRQARVLIIALCLGCFAAAAWSVARGNRDTTARFQVGADTVVTVAPVGPIALQRAVARVDPDRRFAMAAVRLQNAQGALLAVDAPRLPLAASWPRGISATNLADVAKALRPRTAPSIQLSAAPLLVRATVTRSSLGLRGVNLAAWVFTDHGGAAIVNLGALRAGTHTYPGNLVGQCQGGCQLTGLGVIPAPRHVVPGRGSVSVRIDGLSSRRPGGAPRPVSAELVSGGWRAAAGGVQITPGRRLEFTTGVTALRSETGGSGTSIAPPVTVADHPRRIPAAVTTELAAINNAGAVGSLPTQGLDGNNVAVRPVVRSSALPRVGSDGAMVDLGFVSAVQTGPTSPDATDEVWLGPHAPSGAIDDLRSAGLHPVAVNRAATVFHRLQRTGPALADDFLLVATLAALLIAAASTLGALGATTRERATELSSLEVSGTRRPALIRALGLEAAILALTALFGAGAGVLAAVLAVPSLPELTSATLAPLQYTLPAGVIALVAAVVIAIVLLAAGAVGTILVRRMSPSLLRTAPDDVSA
jgi:putative ABC transport system permease protein